MDAFIRQNEKPAITLQKAAYYCERNEKAIKYLMVCVSILICILSIINKFLDKMIQVDDIDKIQKNIADGLVVAGGVFMVGQIFLSRFAHRMHVENINLLERCDCYVFNIAPNKAILRQIPDAVIEDYASRVRKPDSEFKNFYYNRPEKVASPAEINENIFKFQKNLFETDYRLMLFVKGFFMTLWLAFAALIFAMALTFNATFLVSLINVLIPSLSAIVMIFSSSHTYNEHLRCLNNSITAMNEVESATKTPLIIRGVQDALFNLRVKSFLIPSFLINIHRRKIEKETWGYDVKKLKPISDLSIRHLPDGKTENYDIRTTPLPPVNKFNAPEHENFEEIKRIFAESDTSARATKKSSLPAVKKPSALEIVPDKKPPQKDSSPKKPK